MKCPEDLGTPISLHIWHDNTGGSEASWYLGKIVLIDLQQKRWLVIVFIFFQSDVSYTAQSDKTFESIITDECILRRFYP